MRDVYLAGAGQSDFGVAPERATDLTLGPPTRLRSTAWPVIGHGVRAIRAREVGVVRTDPLGGGRRSVSRPVGERLVAPDVDRVR